MSMTFREYLLLEADPKKPAIADKNAMFMDNLKAKDSLQQKDQFGKRMKQNKKRFKKRIEGEPTAKDSK